MDNPHAFYRNRAAIVPPADERQDYEIKPQMISLVKQHLFHGLHAEMPTDHIENFEEICSTTSSNGMNPDFLKCKLFPFSLADKASRWLKSLPAGSITTWPQCRAAFLDHFYTKTMTASLRNKISTFQQHSGESFCEAWERFKEYKRECPHHGFTDENLLGTFYDGVDWKYRNTLNAASNGDFMTKTREGAYKLIENLAASSKNHCHDHDEPKSVSSVESQKIDELTAKVDMLFKGIQQSVKLCEDRGCERYAEANYAGEDNVPDKSFQPRATTSQDELKSLMHLVLLNQQKCANEINVKVDNMYNDFDSRFEAISSHVKRLDIQVAQNAEANKSPQGVLPAPGNCPETVEHLLPEGAPAPSEKKNEEVAGPSSTVLRPPEFVDKVRSRVYKPPIPYPVPPRDQRDPINAEKLNGFMSMARRIPKEISFEKAWENLPIQDFFWNCRETQEEIKDIFDLARSIPLRVLPKVEDPGKFVVPCSIFGVALGDSLCDSGSSVNLMPRDFAEALNIVDIRPSRMSIRFADASVAASQGLIENLNVQIGDCLIPTDFEVVEMNNGSYMPLILGRPFLATAGAVFDLPNKKVVFSNIDERISYKAISANSGNKCGSCVAIDDVAREVNVLSDAPLRIKNEVDEVLDGDTRSYEKKPKKVNKRDKPKREKGIAGSHITLTPQRCVGDLIEYKMKGKGMSRPFSKVNAIITPEFKEKGQAAMASMLSKVLQLNISDQRESGPRLDPPPPSPDPDKKFSNPHMDSAHA